MDIVIEGAWRALQDLDGQGCYDISLLGYDTSTVHCLYPNSTDKLGPINQCQTLHK